MKISAVIPHWPAVPGADECLRRCVSSLDADETLVIVNEGIGFSKAVNQGLRLATGDYIAVVNNDTQLIQGSLKDLCNPFGPCVPRIIPEPRDHMPRAFFVMSRQSFNAVGEYDERFEGGYFEDDDMIRRMDAANATFIYTPTVVVTHLNGGGQSMKFLGEQKFFDKNKKVYEEKWNES